MASDQATQLVIQDLRQKTIEYTAEGIISDSRYFLRVLFDLPLL